MARKRSVSGRSRVRTAENRIRIQTEKINRKLRGLEKSGYYGHYKSKELIRFVEEEKKLTIKKGRGSRRHRLVVEDLKDATFGRLALISKKFKQFIKSKASTKAGITDIKKQTIKTLKKTLKGIKGKKVTDKDIEMFYELVEVKSDDIISKIGPSDFYAVVSEAKEKNYDVDEWVRKLNDYVTINNEDLQETAKLLYDKYVR